MTEKQREYLLDNELKLWMKHDMDRNLIKISLENNLNFYKTEKKIICDILVNKIYERIDRYDKVYDTVNDDDPKDVIDVERHIINMYVLSEEEMEGLLSV